MHLKINVGKHQDISVQDVILSLSLFRYYIKGEHEGKSEVFVPNLPGVPDNIRLSSRGGYWVGISIARTETTHLIEQYPRARNFLAKVTINKSDRVL